MMNRYKVYEKACRVRKAMERAHNNATDAKREVARQLHMREYRKLRSELRELEELLNN